jgi:hypothetical protein
MGWAGKRGRQKITSDLMQTSTVEKMCVTYTSHNESSGRTSSGGFGCDPGPVAVRIGGCAFGFSDGAAGTALGADGLDGLEGEDGGSGDLGVGLDGCNGGHRFNLMNLFFSKPVFI